MLLIAAGLLQVQDGLSLGRTDSSTTGYTQLLLSKEKHEQTKSKSHPGADKCLINYQ